ncbi:MAG: cupredoxin domain-containing protein [Acidimicrobiales bacterium]
MARRLSGRWVATTLALILSLASLSVLFGASVDASATKHDAIEINNFMFHPMVLKVKPGVTVTVTNEDDVVHTLSAVDGKFNTGDILPGATKTFTAPMKRGKYRYICMIHQFMKGTIDVT